MRCVEHPHCNRTQRDYAEHYGDCNERCLPPGSDAAYDSVRRHAVHGRALAYCVHNALCRLAKLCHHIGIVSVCPELGFAVVICTVARAVVYIRAAGDGCGRVHIARAEHAVVAVVHIGGHEAVEAPLAAENIVHQLGRGAAPLCAYAVEAAHGGVGVALVCRHYAAECLEIDLADSLFVCPYSDAFAMRFAVVEGKVLFIHNKSFGLDAYALAGAYRG